MASHVLAHYPLGARVGPAINAFVTLISSPSLRLAAASGDAVAGEVRSRWMISMRSQFDPKLFGYGVPRPRPRSRHASARNRKFFRRPRPRPTDVARHPTVSVAVARTKN